VTNWMRLDPTLAARHTMSVHLGDNKWTSTRQGHLHNALLTRPVGIIATGHIVSAPLCQYIFLLLVGNDNTYKHLQ
jgi:hypothetical protein